jgi:hypothetical protein
VYWDSIQMTRLSKFEHAVLEMLLAGDIPALNILRRQLQSCTVAKREFTGAGVFVELNVMGDCEKMVPPEFRFGDVEAKIDGLENGAGFVLLVEDGRLKLLEGYSYNEEWPKEISHFELTYSTPAGRDWDSLQKAIC